VQKFKLFGEIKGNSINNCIFLRFIMWLFVPRAKNVSKLLHY